MYIYIVLPIHSHTRSLHVQLDTHSKWPLAIDNKLFHVFIVTNYIYFYDVLYVCMISFELINVVQILCECAWVHISDLRMNHLQNTSCL